jgi:RecJ-like exonuclease
MSCEHNADRRAVCPDCGGDGKETCHNPDHGFIHLMMGWHEIGRLGCPVCGHDSHGKVKNGGKCETCDGVGKVTVKTAEQFIEAMDYDIEVQIENDAMFPDKKDQEKG